MACRNTCFTPVGAFPLRIILVPFMRCFECVFSFMMQADVNDLHLGMATGRVPPGWSLENDARYPLRHWVRDVEVWAASTDIAEARIGPACAQRITGAAKIIVREIPIQTLIQGQAVPDAQGNMIQVSGIGMLVRILERRYGSAPQEVQIHSISELMGFVRGHHESTDGVLARFEIMLNRAELQGGVVFGPQIKSWLLLSHLRIPRASWFTLLSPTQGMLPADNAEYIDFAQYLRRNGHLFDKTPADSQKTLAQPYFVVDGDSSSQDPVFPAPAFPAWNADVSTTVDDDDDLISWHSYSTGQSDYDEPVDWDGFDQIPNEYLGEEIYLAYRGAKRRWRNFAGKGRPRFKGRGKGSGKGKGKSRKGPSPNPTFWTDDFGHHHLIPEPPSNSDSASNSQTYFKGRGKGNPIGKDGKVMLCSICDSDQHFRAKCPKGSGKGKGGSGKGKGHGKAFFLGNDDASFIPNSAPIPASRPSYFASDALNQPRSALSELSQIYFADGSPSLSLAPVVHSSIIADVSHEDLTTFNALSSQSSMYYPAWINTAFHTRVKLAQGEAMLIDTGAVGNLSGDVTVKRMAALANARGHGTEYKKLAKVASIDGVGSSASTCSETASVPIALPNGQLASYNAALIEGSEVPALLGLTSMTEKRILVDLIHDQMILVGKGGFEMKLSPGSEVLQCQRSPTGHLMLPCSHWDKLKSFKTGVVYPVTSAPASLSL